METVTPRERCSFRKLKGNGGPKAVVGDGSGQGRELFAEDPETVRDALAGDMIPPAGRV